MTTKKQIDIREELLLHIVRKYKTQAAAAEAWKVAPSYVSSVLHGRKEVPDFMAREAGFEKVQPEARWVRLSRK